MKPAVIIVTAVLGLTCTTFTQEKTDNLKISEKTRKRSMSKSARQRLRAIREVVDACKRQNQLDEIIFRALEDEDTRIRLIAVRTIRQSKRPPETIPQALLARLSDDSEIAAEAMRAIAQTETWAEQAREPLCRLAQSLRQGPADQIKAEALRCFASLDDPRLIPLLTFAARFGRAEVGTTAISALLHQTSAQRVRAIEGATRSVQAEVRAAALHAIRAHYPATTYRASLVMSLLRDEAGIVRSAAGETIISWSTSDDDTTMVMWRAQSHEFAKLASASDPHRRIWVKSILGTLDRDTIAAAVSHPDAPVRRLAFTTLKKLGDAQLASAHLAEGLGDSNESVVRAALSCTRRFSTDAVKATSALIALLVHTESRELRNSAADTLEALGEAAIPELIETLATPKLRIPVAAVLERFEPTDSMLDGLDHRDPSVRTAIVEILGKTATADDSTLFGLLVDKLTDSSPQVLQACITSLGRHLESAIPQLHDALVDSDPILRRRAALVLGELQPYPRCPIAINITALSEPHPPFRILALNRLSGLPPAQAIPHLRAALNDRNVDVKRAAVTIIREFRDDAASTVNDLVRLVQSAPGPESSPGSIERLALRRQIVELAPSFGLAGLPILHTVLELDWPQSANERYHATKLVSRALASLSANRDLARASVPAILKFLTRSDMELTMQFAALRLLEELELSPTEDLVSALRTVLAHSHEQLKRFAVGSRAKVRSTLVLDFDHQAVALRLLGRCSELSSSPELKLALADLDRYVDKLSSARGTAHATRILLHKDMRAREDALQYLRQSTIRNVDHIDDLLCALSKNPATQSIAVLNATKLISTPFLCADAVRFLSRSNDTEPSVIPLLLEQIDHRNPEIVTAAIIGLSKRGETKALIKMATEASDTTLGTIAAAVSNANPLAFAQILEAVEASKNHSRKLRRILDAVHPQHPELTLALFRSPQIERRALIERRITRLYGKAKPQTTQVLLDYLFDPNTPGQTEIIAAILQLGIAPTEAHLQILEQRYRKAKDPAPIARLILRIGKAAVPTLVSLLDTAPQPVLAALGDLGPDAQAAIKPLLAFALREAEWIDATVLTLASIGTRAHTALAKLGVEGPEMVKVLIQVLQSSQDSRVLASTARLLQLYRDSADQAIPVLATLLPKAKQPARAWFALTLASLKPDAPQAAEALLDTLAEPNAELRRHAVRGLSKMADPTGIHLAILKTLDTDPDPRVRAAAEKAQAKLSGK